MVHIYKKVENMNKNLKLMQIYVIIFVFKNKKICYNIS